MRIQEYNNLSQIPDAVFAALIPRDCFYFSKPFLEAFATHNPAINHAYFVLMQQEKPVALAIIQQLQVSLENATAQMPLHARIANTARCIFAGRMAQIAVCGNIYLSGHYGVYVKDTSLETEVFQILAAFLKKSVIASRSSVLFFKDFNARFKEVTIPLVQNKFAAFQVEPNMLLKIAPSWSCLADYVNDLKSKYRVKVNRANTLSATLIVKSFTAAQILEHKVVLQKLLANITDKALVSTTDLNIATYAALKEAFPNEVLFNAYYYGDFLVAFATGFITPNQLDAHFIGLDYSKNKQLALYPRILNDYVKIAIEQKVALLNLGRTSAEIKSTLGATPEPLNCYVRHKRTVANLVFRPFVRQLKTASFKQHEPFKSL